MDPDGGKNALARGLKNRHVQMIALGGAIGSGLFLGSAQAIHRAGPGLLLAYALGGLAVFMVARALGELLLYRTAAGSFATYVSEFVNPCAGFVTGWSYWFSWVVVGIAEITAVSIYMRYWFPTLPQWSSSLGTLTLLTSVNLLNVKFFGEFEFWFALIKVLAVVGLLLFGGAVLLFGVGGMGHSVGVSNLWTHGGIFANGIPVTIMTLPAALFAFGGIEIIGVAAAETEDPAHTLPRAINGALVRILVFYIGAVAIIMSLVPWTAISPNASPFVMVFDHFGIPAASTIVNLVVITAAASACNSGLYSSGRMLHTLAVAADAPAIFSHVSSRHVPARGVLATAFAMLAGVVLNYCVPEKAFKYIVSVDIVILLWTWAIIVVSQLAYRRAVLAGRLKPSPYRMPLAPFSGYATLAFFALIFVLLGFDQDTRIALYVTPVWAAAMAIGWRMAATSRVAERPTVFAYLENHSDCVGAQPHQPPR